MIIAVDIETEGLDATKFIMGCIIKENSKNPEIYHNKQELWERIKKLGYSEAKRGKVLNVYSHNAQYDTAGYVDFNDKHLVFFSNKPFIWAYRLSEKECEENKIEHTPGMGKEIIKFLDTWAIFKMSLKKLGEMINLQKYETPQFLLEQQEKGELSTLNKRIIEQYMIRDTEICYDSIKYLKKLLKQQKVNVKRIYTINQIAINYLLCKMKQLPKETTEKIFWNTNQGEVRRTFREKEIHEAYRGGRVEAFTTGIIEKANYVDCNSLYPYSATKIEMPDLRTERKIWEPLKIGITKEEIKNKIGITRCIIENKTNEIGLLPIRTDIGSYYPKKGTTLIGTWTNIELKKAEEEGYEIKDIEYTITYEKMENPFKKIFNEMYEERKKQTGINNYFYKMMMNASIGKLAQHRTGQEIVIDDVDKVEKYLNNNYKTLRGIERKYFYKKEIKGIKKKYYMPIVPTLINAYARIYMYNYFKKIPLENLIYTDTDSCIFTGNYFNKFPISEKMGDFKIEYNNEKCIIYGRKTYAIGKRIILAGFNTRDIKIEDFEKGYVKSRKMITVNTAKGNKEIGTFYEEERNLNTQEEQFNEAFEMLKKQELLIDNNLKEINYFLNSEVIQNNIM